VLGVGFIEGAVAELADALWRAERDGAPIAPLTDTHPDLGTADGYAIQAHNVARRTAAGASVRGRKLGLTSRRTQELLGVTEPTFGVLLSDMFVDDGAALPLAGLVAPRVEAELAFVLADDVVGPAVTTEDALAAIGEVRPALEVVDSRIVDWRSRIADTVADNAGGARVVLGDSAAPVAGLDLRLLGVLLSRNGSPIDSGAGAAALGHPAAGVAWLANTLAGYGERLHRGDVVLAGALTRMVPVRPGDAYTGEFAHLGAVHVRFGGPR
jgi:2-keto-4-pentenoate hydratase